jgi:CDP-6-deoxy-D-xylo-4-hexulose-3-dehydrase
LPNIDTVVDHKYLFSNVGYNLKPLDMQGAIGIEQLEKFDEIHKKRIMNKETISNFFEKYIEGVRIVNERKSSETSWFGVPIVCETSSIKDSLVKYLEKNKIQTRNYFAGNILLHPAYKNLDDAWLYPNANSVLEKVFFVGCSPTYSKEIINYVESTLKDY